jgi:hypothetical protein
VRLLLVIFCTLCSLQGLNAAIADYMLEMQTGDDRFVLVVLLEKDISLDAARAEALRRAAEISKEAGYKYFEVRSEMTVQAIKRINRASGEGKSTLVVPALRMSFRSTDEEPSESKSYRVADYAP